MLGEIGLTGAHQTLRRQQRQRLPGDRARSNDRTVSVLAPIDEMFFEFLRELEKTADRFPSNPRRRRSTAGLRTSRARAQEMYRWLETRG